MQDYNGEPIAWQFGVVEGALLVADRQGPESQAHADPAGEQRWLERALRARGRRRDDVDLRQDLPANLRALSLTARTARTATLWLAVVLCGPRVRLGPTISSPRSSAARSPDRPSFLESRAGRRLDAADLRRIGRLAERRHAGVRRRLRLCAALLRARQSRPATSSTATLMTLSGNVIAAVPLAA